MKSSILHQPVKLFDAHNHLQDDRFNGAQADLLETCRRNNIAGMVVNGSCENDWGSVQTLAELHKEIIPAFGCHPWYLAEASADWKEKLIEYLKIPGATIGEIGLDRWKPGLDFDQQQKFFIAQLELAHDRNLPASIHCLKAWGPLLEILRHTPLPQKGFLLHSYGGSIEMVEQLAELGAYFSCAGNYLSPEKARKFAVCAEIPLDRLLIESDAPDQNLPENLDLLKMHNAETGKRINHPANLQQTYKALAEQRGLELEDFAGQIEANFIRLFRS